MTEEEKEVNRQNVRKYRQTEEGKKVTRRYRLKYKYNLSEVGFNTLYRNQGGRCAICREIFKETPHTDHNHKTGKVRGLLCRKCNSILGYAKDTIEILVNAVSYLEKEKVSGVI